MAKAKRIKQKKIKEKNQMSELFHSGINFLNSMSDEADFFIVTVPGVGSFDVTSNVKENMKLI